MMLKQFAHKKAILCLVALMLGTPSAAKAEISGSKYLEFCESSDSYDRGLCDGIAAGTVSTFNMAQSLAEFKKGICLPKTATVGGAKNVILHYLKDRPQQRDLPASFLAYVALTGAYPCQH